MRVMGIDFTLPLSSNGSFMMQKCPLDIFCEKIAAGDICGVSPFIAIISNPQGSVALDSFMSSELSYVFMCLEGAAFLYTESGEQLLTKGQDSVLLPHLKVHRFVFRDDFRGYVMLTSKGFNMSIVTRDKYAVSCFYNRSVCRVVFHRVCPETVSRSL